MSFHDAILTHGRLWPEKPAIILVDRVVTFGMMRSGILAVAGYLQSRGVKPGQIVAICVDTGSWNLIVTCALAHLGAVGIAFARTSDIETSGVPIDHIISRIALPHPASNVGLHRIDETWFTFPGQPVAPAGFRDPNAVARLALSSGTTGRPKVIAFTRRALEARQLSWVQAADHTPWDRLLLMVGLATYFGFSVAIFTLSLGRTLLIAEAADEALRMAALYEAEALVGSNHFVEGFAAAHAKNPVPLPRLRTCVFGGSLTSPGLADTVLRHVTPLAQVAYGSTENGFVAMAPLAGLDIARGAVGYVAPRAEVEIVDEDGNIVPPGTEGIIRTRTEHAAKPYFPHTDEGRYFDAEGWHYPGDTGRLDTDGLLYITGRSDHLLNVGGGKIAPERVEDRVRGLEGLVDVAATMPVPGEVWLVAVARPSLTEAMLAAWCRAHLPNPPIKRVLFVEGIPRTGSGKIRRGDVQTMARAARSTGTPAGARPLTPPSTQ